MGGDLKECERLEKRILVFFGADGLDSGIGGPICMMDVPLVPKV
jgi:hypothetical protein